MLNKNNTLWSNIKNDINPKSWLSSYKQTSITYLIIFLAFYSAIGIVFEELTNSIISFISPSYNPPLKEFYIFQGLAAGPIEDIIFFGIPFYLLLNPIVPFIGGIVWSIIHILPMDGIVNSLNNLYFSQMLFVIPNLFFHYRTWISGKGWFAILSHSIWNLSIFSLCSLGIGEIGVKCIQNFEIGHLIGYTIISSILIILIYFIYNSRRRQEEEEYETNKHILITDNNNRQEPQEKVADNISTTPPLFPNTNINSLQYFFKNNQKYIVIIASISIAFGAISLASSSFLLAESIFGPISIGDFENMDIITVFISFVPYGLIYYTTGILVINKSAWRLCIILPIAGLALSLVSILFTPDISSTLVSQILAMVGLIISGLLLCILIKPNIKSTFNTNEYNFLPIPIRKKANVYLQMVFAAIPFVNIWTAYRIQKLRKFLIVLIPSSVIITFLVPFPYSSIPLAIIVVYFIGRWSKQWNKNLAYER